MHTDFDTRKSLVPKIKIKHTLSASSHYLGEFTLSLYDVGRVDEALEEFFTSITSEEHGTLEEFFTSITSEEF